MSALRGAILSQQSLQRVMRMAIETFDQRFKRLTSDMLMLDICRTLGIEIRDLMKVRSGVRVELSLTKLRRLCQDQGLDFASFTRDIAAPWSSELKPSETITSDAPAPSKRVPVESNRPAPIPAAAQRFRDDGSRIFDESEAPAIRNGSLPSLAGETNSGTSVVGRIRAAVANAAAMLAPELPERGDDLHIDEYPHPTMQPMESYNYSEPKKIAPAATALRVNSSSLMVAEQASISSLVAEVSDLKREVTMLASRINQLIGR